MKVKRVYLLCLQGVRDFRFTLRMSFVPAEHLSPVKTAEANSDQLSFSQRKLS